MAGKAILEIKSMQIQKPVPKGTGFILKEKTDAISSFSVSKKQGESEVTGISLHMCFFQDEEGVIG